MLQQKQSKILMEPSRCKHISDKPIHYSEMHMGKYDG